MQALQSNSASHHLVSEPAPDTTTTRFFPSPFSAPIQAARKYLERQRGEAAQSLTISPGGYGQRSSGTPGDARERDQASRDQASGDQASRDQASRDQTSRNQASRDRDRRLERSLYEGHSIEAGLNFGGGLADDFAGDFKTGRGAERAYLADSDGTEPLFPYAVAGPLPNPEVVRGAISRLARESESRRDSAEGEAARSTDFGEVARRVWGAKADVAGTATPDKFSDAFKNDLRDCATDIETNTEADTATTARDLAGDLPAETNPDFAPAVERLETSSIPGCDVESEPALAHDACNLLSALALYSELLASPGVLSEQHRCYAEEMRLLAGRSHVLVDRLLRVSAGRPARSSQLGAETTSSPESSVQHAGAANGAARGTIQNAIPDAIQLGSEVGSDVPDLANLCDQPDASDSSDGFLSSEAALSRVIAGTAPERIRVEAASLSAPEARAGLEVPRATTAISPAQGAVALVEQTTVVESSCRAAGRPIAATNMVDLLMRWGSLLSTLAQGTLEVVFGANPTTPVPVEAEALERILVNLVRNARAATIRGGAIRISVGMVGSGMVGSGTVDFGTEAERPGTGFDLDRERANTETMVLTVDDSGCGMTEAQIRHILQEDGEAKEPSAGRAGHGLGLQIVRQLVAASGGAISILSVPGRGTRIEVCWPVKVESLARTAAELQSDILEEAHILKAGVNASAASRRQSLQERAEIEKVAEKTAEKALELAAGTVTESAAEKAVQAGAGSGPVRAPERSREGVGPDGFNETELRAMILRLHRGGSPERSPLSRRLGSRPGGLREAARGFGTSTPSVVRDNRNGAESDESGQNDGALKGAIAC